MAKIIIKFPYCLKPGPRIEKANQLRKSLEENEIIVLDASYEIQVIKDADGIYIDPRTRSEWITNREYIDKEFNGHYDGSCFNSPYNCRCCGYSPKDNRPNFCPNCGADMRGENDTPTTDESSQ